ncbi:MAG: UDP-N-acetylmuramoyl-tripeptide--D-alanyl-D-alanine ligase [Acidimicrobiaceae bacterium]
MSLLRTRLWRTELRRNWQRVVIPVVTIVARVHRGTIVRNVRVVAVVGSYGKTTTARAIASVLGGDGRTRHLALMVLRLRRRDRHAVLEVRIRLPGQMARYARLVRPQIVVVTSIGSEHNKTLRTLEITRDEKADMVRALPPSGIAVLNGDDPNVMWMATQTRATVTTFGFDPSNDVWADDVRIDWPHGTRFVLHAENERRAVEMRLFGRHFVAAVLASVAVAIAEGVNLDSALVQLQRLPPTRNRLELQQLPNGAFVLYDHYKSALETVDAALDVLEEVPARRKIVVLGDVEEPPGRTIEEVGAMYDRLGARVAAIATQATFVHIDTEGPRPTYVASAQAHGLHHPAMVEVNNVFDALSAMPSDLGDGDVVLVKGSAQQRFHRLALALSGRTVRCALVYCHAHVECAHCPMLERGWDDR